MAIFIAPIGVHTEHVKTWLKEEAKDVNTLWLIHSKKTPKYDLPKTASDLEKDLKRAYPQIKIHKKQIEDAFSVDPTMDAIHQVIIEEEKKDPSLIRKEFVINITGGTNVSAAAAILAATFYGTRAHYVKEPQKDDPRNTTYVNELPVQPLGIAKLNENQLQVLKTISDSTYEIPDTPSGLDSKITPGSIERSQLLKKLGCDNLVKGSAYKRKEGETRLLGITKKLEAAGLIQKISFTESYVDENADKKMITVMELGYSKRVENKNYKPKWKLVKNEKEVRYQVTAAGKRKARDAFMFE